MKYIKLFVPIILIGFTTSTAIAGVDLKSKKDKESYGIGVDVANNFKRLAVDINLDALFRGFRDVYTGKKLAMSNDELNQVMATYNSELKNKQFAAQKALMYANEKAGDEFIEKYRADKGVIVLPSGILYKIIKEGNGQKPKLTSTVVSRYKGSFVDGKEFDNSDRTGGSVSFNVQGVIPGWQEVLQLMPVGSHWEVVIPSKLAYGAQGAGRQIGPNSTLVFDIELLSIKDEEPVKIESTDNKTQK